MLQTVWNALSEISHYVVSEIGSCDEDNVRIRVHHVHSYLNVVYVHHAQIPVYTFIKHHPNQIVLHDDNDCHQSSVHTHSDWIIHHDQEISF